MRSLIAYYSFTGNTKKIAIRLGEILNKKSEVVIERLLPYNETRNFFRQCLQARIGKRPELTSGLSFDISAYDLMCIGTPVWAFAPAPAINTYLDRLSGARGKKAVIFTTFGSGAGVRRCVEKMKKCLLKKGVLDVNVLNIQGARIDDFAFVDKKIAELII